MGDETSSVNRREFVVIAAAAAAACACAADAVLAEPPKSGGPKPAPGGGGQGGAGGGDKGPRPTLPTTKFEAGALTDYDHDGIYDNLLKDKRVLIIREKDKIRAVSGLCTHRGCAVAKVKDDEIECPCHHSHFTVQGSPTGGPAKAALFRLGISVNDAGKIIVDPTKKFGEKEWENKGASIDAPAKS